LYFQESLGSVAGMGANMLHTWARTRERDLRSREVMRAGVGRLAARHCAVTHYWSQAVTTSKWGAPVSKASPGDRFIDLALEFAVE
jgi:hypothetical protein